MKAWYFSSDDRKLRYNDNRIIKAGLTHKVDCKPILCQHGLHASTNILDALMYAPGAYVWRVKLGGEIVKGDDKLVATERSYLWGYDATDVLWRFSRLNALDVVHLWDAPDVVVRFLKTGDEDLRDAAWDAAWDAARAAAWDAAWDAARAATRDATRAAARAATRDATRAAARAAARDAAWDAAWEKQSRRLYRMIMGGRK